MDYDTGNRIKRNKVFSNKNWICMIVTSIFICCTLSIITSITAQKTVTVATLEQSSTTYTVVAGDTLWSIAEKFNITVDQITILNDLESTDLQVGQVLRMPNIQGVKYIEYIVRPQNTVGLLAEYFGTTIEDIKSLNNLSSDLIYVGQTLKIPANYNEYMVRAGDFLFSIASRYNVDVQKLKLYNGLTDEAIYPGQILRVPSVAQAPNVTYITHLVKSGETVWDISVKYGIPQFELLKVNGLTESSVLDLGQKLTIPVYVIPVKPTPGPQFGEYLDWWTEAQYVFPIGKIARVRDFTTGRAFNVKRTIGANHADCEPLTTQDAQIMKELWGGQYSWATRASILEVDGRKIAASLASTPHGVEFIANNGFTGHFDIHFKNSTRHKDGSIDNSHQAKIRIAAGIDSVK